MGCQCQKMTIIHLFVALVYLPILSLSLSLRAYDTIRKMNEGTCLYRITHAVRGMAAWEKMRSGAMKLMEKYAVHTCGYCPEVQVGPKGHWVRQCQAYKHQMRDGQHAWQEATVDDLVPPVYVWHVRDLQDGEVLVDSLKRLREVAGSDGAVCTGWGPCGEKLRWSDEGRCCIT